MNVKVSRTGEDKSTFVAPVYKSTFTIDIKEKITVQGTMDQTRPDLLELIESILRQEAPLVQTL